MKVSTSRQSFLVLYKLVPVIICRLQPSPKCRRKPGSPVDERSARNAADGTRHVADGTRHVADGTRRLNLDGARHRSLQKLFPDHQANQSLFEEQVV